jgi:hypothetical protein
MPKKTLKRQRKQQGGLWWGKEANPDLKNLIPLSQSHQDIVSSLQSDQDNMNLPQSTQDDITKFRTDVYKTFDDLVIDFCVWELYDKNDSLKSSLLLLNKELLTNEQRSGLDLFTHFLSSPSKHIDLNIDKTYGTISHYDSKNTNSNPENIKKNLKFLDTLKEEIDKQNKDDLNLKVEIYSAMESQDERSPFFYRETPVFYPHRFPEISSTNNKDSLVFFKSHLKKMCEKFNKFNKTKKQELIIEIIDKYCRTVDRSTKSFGKSSNIFLGHVSKKIPSDILTKNYVLGSDNYVLGSDNYVLELYKLNEDQTKQIKGLLPKTTPLLNIFDKFDNSLLFILLYIFVTIQFTYKKLGKDANLTREKEKMRYKTTILTIADDILKEPNGGSTRRKRRIHTTIKRTKK